MDAKERKKEMEFLKKYFEEGALTYEQLAEKLSKDKTVKLANLATGEYVGTEKYKAAVAEQKEMKKALEMARQETQDFGKMDLAEMQEQVAQYKAQAENAKQQAEQQVQSVKYMAMVQALCAKISFSSESAKDAFMSAVIAEQLPMENDILVGFEEFEQAWREKDPQAFAQEGVVPKIVAPSKAPSNGNGWREKIGLNYQNAKQQIVE